MPEDTKKHLNVNSLVTTMVGVMAVGAVTWTAAVNKSVTTLQSQFVALEKQVDQQKQWLTDKTTDRFTKTDGNDLRKDILRNAREVAYLRGVMEVGDECH